MSLDKSTALDASKSSDSGALGVFLGHLFPFLKVLPMIHLRPVAWSLCSLGLLLWPYVVAGIGSLSCLRLNGEFLTDGGYFAANILCPSFICNIKEISLCSMLGVVF
jgi:hypothetical protein